MTISCSDHGRIMVGLSSNRLYIGGSNSSFQCNLELKDFVAGAVFGEVIEGDFACSAHCK